MAVAVWPLRSIWWLENLTCGGGGGIGGEGGDGTPGAGKRATAAWANLLPALATVDGEAGVLALELGVLHGLSADEVRHGFGTGRAEGVLRRLRGLEEHVVVAVSVELAWLG